MIFIIFIILVVFILLFKLINKNYLLETENNRNIKMMGNHDMKYYISFSSHLILFNMFKKIVEKFNKYNVKYFLSCGGLIGYHRHNKGLIPWDDDLDICVFEKDQELVRKCLQEVEKENDYTFKPITYNIKVDRIYSNSIFIDIFYLKYYENNKFYHYNYDSLNKVYKNEYIYKNEIFPLKTVDYYLYAPNGSVYDEIKISIPNKSIKFLDRAYKNWNIIKKYHMPHTLFYILYFIDFYMIKDTINIYLKIY
jgi:phosphorylcholine metabolism protein LicD